MTKQEIQEIGEIVRVIVREEVVGIKTDVSSLKKDVSSLKADMTDMKADVAALKTCFIQLEARVTILEEDQKQLIIVFEEFRERVLHEFQEMREQIAALWDLAYSSKERLDRVRDAVAEEPAEYITSEKSRG